MERHTPPGEQPGASDTSPEPPYTATVTVNEQGIITGWSDGARRLLGYTPAEIVGHSATRLLADNIHDTGVAAEQAWRDMAGQRTAWRDVAGRERLSGTMALRHRDGHRLR